MRENTRQEQIKKKTNPEIVKHPYNGHLWVGLANFIYDQDGIDLQEIAKRQQERKRIMQ
jgi:hypothetical protein